jgi:hypothetical protein
MKIVGAGRDKTTIHGDGFRIEGTKEEGTEVDMQDMTINGASESGLSAYNGLSWLCDSMTFTQCGRFGVWAKNTRGRLINCVITECRLSGIACGPKALIELEGAQTKVDGNVKSGNSYLCGLSTCDTSSRIHLLFPLTQESVSTSNAGGGNYGGKGEIAIVDNDGNTIESINESTE